MPNNRSLSKAGFLSVVLLVLSFTAFSQEKCGIVAYQKLLKAKHHKLENESHFEDWLKSNINKRKAAQGDFSRQADEVVTIPVVVHIIHSGEPLGIGKNLTEEQIISQIDVLNEDFRRTNADASNTPAAFQPVAADIEIQFVLAKRDPEGLPTDGIVRIEGNQATYGISEQYQLKSQSYWPSEDYLNIWVADIGNDYLGYAQFPVSSLDGLEDASDYHLTDGVAIDYLAFGSEDKYDEANLLSQYNLGRTTTHEIGHYFGLRHIWGDNSQCSIGDYCDDTPEASSSHSGLGDCAFPTSNNGCGSDDMFQNYMDYTDDGCMNLFTLDQKTRMRIVLDESPRRASLKDSKGGLPPVVADDDLGLRTIIAPRPAECQTSFTPTVEVRNYGTNDITSSQIAFKINGIVQETLSSSHSLSNLETEKVTFNSVNVSSTGSYTFEFEIISTNGTTDGNPDNNIIDTETFIPETESLPVAVDFESPFTNWTVQNLDGLRTWKIASAPNENPGNQALTIDFYDYEQEGELDLLTSPALDFSSTLTAALSFDVAYAQFGNIDSEGLIITISGTCDDALTEADTIFSQFGKDLSTINTSSFFTPAGAGDWKTELVDISDYAGSETVRISFIAVNAYGNNIYLDNINIISKDDEDIAISKVNRPSRVSCASDQQLEVVIQNAGIVPVGYFELQYTIDGGDIQTTEWQSTDSLRLSEEAVVTADLSGLAVGDHEIEIYALNPNGVEEPNTNNNYAVHTFEINDNEDIVPIKESFENFSSSSWVINNPDNDKTWELTTTTRDNSLMLNGSTYTSGNQEDWLVSPTLDFRNIQTASLNFNVAYANGSQASDGLNVYISTDCGQSFNDLVYQKFGDELATAGQTDDFFPEADSLWRNEEIDLAYLVGQPDVRIAFVSTNNNGNNIYLDDIQVYVTDHDDIVANTMYPNPSQGKPVNLTFDLDEKETISILVYDRTGRLILQQDQENTLNQTYTLDLNDEPEGIYLVKVAGQSFSFVKRLMVTHTK